MKHSWFSLGCVGFAGTLNQFPPRQEEQQFFSQAWQPLWQAETKPALIPGGTLLDWFLPQPAYAAWWEGKIPAWDQQLLRPRTDLTRCYLPEVTLSQALQSPRPLTGPPFQGNQGPFSQYCLGVNSLQEGHQEEAQVVFQELAQNHDPFWQSLARVRLADLELSRLQADPAP